MKNVKRFITTCMLVILFLSSTISIGALKRDDKKKVKKTRVQRSVKLFDLTRVAEITLSVTEEEWNTLLTNFDENKRNEKYVRAAVSYKKGKKTKSFKMAGIRIRGNMSRKRPEGKKGEPHTSDNPDWHHAHFKVNFDKFSESPKKKKLSTLKGINLKWFKDDGMYVREIYCYDLFRRFDVWTAPRAAYCKVFVKIGEDDPAYFGIYEMIEPIDVEYLQTRFVQPKKASTGFLWKCSWGANLLSFSGVGIEDPDGTGAGYAYDLKTGKGDLDRAKKQLKQFINNLTTLKGKQFEEWTKKYVDVDLLLRAYAVNVLVGMWDDYWANNGNNYYLYFDHKGKAYFIPYDYDNTLGTSLLVANSGTQDVMNWGSSRGVLMTRILKIPEYRDKYIAYINELIDTKNDLFDADKSIARIKEWQQMILADIKNDTNEDMSLIDEPADWANRHFYRLLTGDDSGGYPEANYFRTRIKFAREQVIDPAETGKPKKKDYPEWKRFFPFLEHNFYITNVVVGLKKEGRVYYILQKTGKSTPGLSELKNRTNKEQYIDSGFIDVGKDPVLITFYNLKLGENYEMYLIAENKNEIMQPQSILERIKITPEKPSYTNIEYKGDKVIFRTRYHGPGAPVLRGSFNDWLEYKGANISDWTMTKNEKSRLYEITVDKSLVKNGVEYSFYLGKDLNNGRWAADPANPNMKKDKTGRYISIVR